ncbi:MAG: hypothetical protein ABIY70_11955 [Capsulimonas sp.]|uniref:hypothetical protein n=1 Tax=Capsulimonas sp. TaxID=2494211 RepID=UPI00326416D1
MKRPSPVFAVAVSIGVIILQAPVFIEIERDIEILSKPSRGAFLNKPGAYEFISIICCVCIILYVWRRWRKQVQEYERQQYMEQYHQIKPELEDDPKIWPPAPNPNR